MKSLHLRLRTDPKKAESTTYQPFRGMIASVVSLETNGVTDAALAGGMWGRHVRNRLARCPSRTFRPVAQYVGDSGYVDIWGWAVA